MKTSLTLTAALALVTAVPANADEINRHGGMMPHGTSQHGGMMRVSNNAGATGQAIINSVDTASGVVNLTHGPIPSLSWPEMTMDLPVANDLALTDVQPGDPVRFRVVLGEDQVYRITKLDVMP